MAVQIMNQQLQVKCRFNLLHILECSIHSKYGEHTKAEIKAAVKGEEAKAVLNNAAEEKIEIFGKDTDTSIEQVLFAGRSVYDDYPECRFQYMEDGYKEEIQIVSKSGADL